MITITVVCGQVKCACSSVSSEKVGTGLAWQQRRQLLLLPPLLPLPLLLLLLPRRCGTTRQPMTWNSLRLGQLLPSKPTAHEVANRSNMLYN
jgi:hypothetical protein